MALLTLETNLQGLDQASRELKRQAQLGFPALSEKWRARLESYVQQRMQTYIYDTPERGYIRTGMLLDSVVARRATAGAGQLVITVRSVGGARNRSYALYNERGTYGSRVERDTIMADSLASNDLLGLQPYPRQSTGLESRPFSDPAVAQLSRDIPNELQDHIVSLWNG